MQSRYYRELFPVEKEKMMSEMIWLLTNRQNNRYYEHIASPWRSRFVRLKMPVTGEDYHETDAEMYGNDFSSILVALCLTSCTPEKVVEVVREVETVRIWIPCQTS